MTGEKPPTRAADLDGAAVSSPAPVCPVQPSKSAVEITVEAAARPPRPAKPDPGRVRLCIVSRTELPPDQLIRFVLAPDGQIVADLSCRLPGRGVWVTATKDAVAEAAKRGLFAKSLKQSVRADKGLVDHVERQLAHEARQALSLANKAGLITTGFAKVEIAIEKGAVAALIAANDASSDGTGKLARKFRAIRGAAQLEAPVIADFTNDELSLAFGGSNVIHAAMAAGGAARGLGQRVLMSCLRLRRYRMISDAAGTIAAHAPFGTDQTIADQTIDVTNSDQAGTDQA